MAKSKVKAYKGLAILLAGLMVLVFGYTFEKTRAFLASFAFTQKPAGDAIVVSEPLDSGLIRVDIRFRTGDGPDNLQAISTISSKLTIVSLAGERLRIVDKNGKKITVLVPSQEIALAGNWQFPVNRIEEKGDETVIQFEGIYVGEDGYASSIYNNLFSFYVSGVKSKDNLQFTFDENLSQMLTKDRPVIDIWK